MIDSEKHKELANTVDTFIKEFIKENKKFVDYKILAYDGLMLISGINANGEEILIYTIRTRNFE